MRPPESDVAVLEKKTAEADKVSGTGQRNASTERRPKLPKNGACRRDDDQPAPPVATRFAPAGAIYLAVSDRKTEGHCAAYVYHVYVWPGAASQSSKRQHLANAYFGLGKPKGCLLE